MYPYKTQHHHVKDDDDDDDDWLISTVKSTDVSDCANDILLYNVVLGNTKSCPYDLYYVLISYFYFKRTFPCFMQWYIT